MARTKSNPQAGTSSPTPHFSLVDPTKLGRYVLLLYGIAVRVPR